MGQNPLLHGITGGTEKAVSPNDTIFQIQMAFHTKRLIEKKEVDMGRCQNKLRKYDLMRKLGKRESVLK